MKNNRQFESNMVGGGIGGLNSFGNESEEEMFNQHFHRHMQMQLAGDVRGKIQRLEYAQISEENTSSNYEFSVKMEENEDEDEQSGVAMTFEEQYSLMI